MTRIEDEAVNAIRNSGAHHLRVTVRGEAPCRVAISGRRNKWQQLQATLANLEWSRIDCCDKDGGVIHTIVDEDAPAAQPKSTPTLDAAATLAERFAGLLVQQHQAIIKSQEGQYGATLRGYEQLTERLVGAIGDLRAIFTEALTMQRTAFMSTGGTSGGEGNDTNDMMKMLMMGYMQQRLAPTPATSTAPPPKTPPNGDPTKKPS